MSSFTEMAVTPLNDGINWKLLKSFTYDVGKLGGSDRIKVPRGFKTDFGSAPRFLWGIVSPIGKAIGGFVLHDYLYATQERSRLVSDAILLEAMEICNVNWFQRTLVYRGVRLGGWVSWKAHTKARSAALAAGKSYPELLTV